MCPAKYRYVYGLSCMCPAKYITVCYAYITEYVATLYVLVYMHTSVSTRMRDVYVS